MADFEDKNNKTQAETVNSQEESISKAKASNKRWQNLPHQDINSYEQDEAMVLKAPLFAKEAYGKVASLNQIKKSLSPLKVKYLPEGVLKRKAILEQKFYEEGLIDKPPKDVEQNMPKNNLACSQNEDDSLFYSKAKAKISALETEKKSNLSKIKRNFKVFIIIIIAFVGYYLYQQGTNFDFQKDPIQQVQAQLPLRLDPKNTLTKVELQQDVLLLQVVRAKDALTSITDVQTELDSYVKTASSNLCKLPFILEIVNSGKTLKIQIQLDDQSVQREYKVDSCSI